MRLLKLPREVQGLVAEGQLTEGQVRPLISWDEDFVMSIVPRIIAEGWSARRIEQYMVNVKKGGEEKPKATPQHDATFDAQIATLKNRLKTDVTIRTNAKGAGKIVINFKNQEELERLQSLLDK